MKKEVISGVGSGSGFFSQRYGSPTLIGTLIFRSGEGRESRCARWRGGRRRRCWCRSWRRSPTSSIPTSSYSWAASRNLSLLNNSILKEIKYIGRIKRGTDCHFVGYGTVPIPYVHELAGKHGLD
jgi:hypothetical protein